MRWGGYITFEAPSAWVARCIARCFGEYGLVVDEDGYAALYRPYHLIGLELGIGVVSAVECGEPTGRTRAFLGDVAAVTKQTIAAGEILDGEGGETVYGRLMPAARSVAKPAMPIELAGGARLRRPLLPPRRAAAPPCCRRRRHPG